jgi:hypothetical protein
MFIQTSVLRVVINNEGHLQVAIETLNLGRLGVIGRGGDMPNSPGKTQVGEVSRFNTAAFSETIDWGTPNDGKNFSSRQFFATSDEILLTGYMQTNLEKPSSTTSTATFPLRLLTKSPTNSIKMCSRGLVTTSLLCKPTLEFGLGLALWQP